MTKRFPDDVDTLVSRAQSDRSAKVEPERRHIYGGDPQATVAGYAVRSNRKAIRRKRSTFNSILLLFGVGIAIVLYINNILAVNTLLREVNQLQSTHEKIANTNQMLRAEIDGKSDMERIGRVATEQLGLTFRKEQPFWLEVDESRLRRVEKRIAP